MTLQEYLTSRNLKPSAFAAEIGVAASTISRILSGERSPGLDLLRLIRDRTGGAVTPNDFLEPLTPEIFDRLFNGSAPSAIGGKADRPSEPMRGPSAACCEAAIAGGQDQ